MDVRQDTATDTFVGLSEETPEVVAESQADPERAKRRQILEGARKVFLGKGFDAASMGEIAKAAGVSKGTLYVYFASKEDLFEALTLREREALAEKLFRLDEDSPDVRQVMTRLGISFLEMMLRPDHISSVRMVIGAADRMPRLGRMYYESGPQVGCDRLGAYLAGQVGAGRLAIEDTQAAASQFLALCSGSLFRKALFAVAETASPAEIRRDVDSAVAVFFAAYGAGR